ncbi:MAG TPA: Crp/Fnr family transcriptional regulator [Noviherbaspirillum sp.]|nr:Crp/Fnr family transcriptional regulator [Noviherbaspirillum sp.]
MQAVDLTWRHQNRLLELLPAPEFVHIAPLLSVHEVEVKHVLIRKGAPLRHVDFPCSSVYSALVEMADGATVEVGTIGNEGMASLNALLDGHVATETLICQIPGISLRMRIDDFQWEAESNAQFRTVLDLYAQAYISQVEQSAACNQLHTLEQRTARWLLMTHDRVRQDVFPMTQEFLSFMLGVQRPSVSQIARRLEQEGALSYHRGMMRILRRDLLEATTCECYAATRSQFEHLLGASAG